ncbi:MAG TPA: MazG family protein [Chlamydiales bacterium]|nr:MazG family protein [Chlamydiales bacterium]
MEEFKTLIGIADRLLSPEGCPWDREQTFFTLQPYLLEETHELIEAIDAKDASKISEELGDVLYALIFISKLGEKEGTFTLADAIRLVSEKLIRRHPHVFANKKISSTDEIVSNWEEVKKREGKKSPIDNIPPTLPALARAQKVIHKLKRAKSPVIEETLGEDLGQKLFDLVKEAEAQGLDAESLLRRTCQAYEEKHRR